MAGVEYQVTKVDPTDPETKGMVYQVHKVSEEVAATLGGKVYRARIVKVPDDPEVSGKVYQIVLIGDPDDPAVKGKVYNAILTGGSEAVIVGPGVTPLSLPDAVAEAIDSLIAYGGTEQRSLPQGYQQLDGVVFDGSSYIDTELTSFSNDGVYECDLVTPASLGTTFLFGQNPGSTSPQVGFFTTSYAFAWQYGANSRLSPSVSANTAYSIVAENGKVTKNGVATTGTASESITINQRLFVGAGVTPSSNPDSNTPDPRMFAGTINRFKYTLNNTVMCNLVPAKRLLDNVVGFYDTVRNRFFTNAGTGTMTAGSPVVPTPTPTVPLDIVCNNGALKVTRPSNLPIGYTLLEYIESTGTEYITSSVTSVRNGTFYLDFQMVETPSGFPTIWGAMPGSADYKVVYGSGSQKLYSQPGNGAGYVNTIDKDTNRHQVTITTTTSREVVVVDGQTFSNDFTITEDNEMPLSFFARKRYDGMNNFAKVKLYRAWHKNASNVLDFDVVPVKNPAGVLGLYDMVSGTFYDNEGTGDFVAGPNATDPITLVVEGTQETIAITADGATVSSATCENLFAVGDNTDSQDIISGEVTRKTGILVLDGVTTGKKIGTAWNSTYKRGSFAVSDMKSTAASVSDALSSYFGYSQSVYGAPTVSGFCTNNGSVFICFLGLDSVTSAETANAWLAGQYAAGTPVIIVYSLATETTETVTGQPMETAEGDNQAVITQASIDGLQLKVEYEKEAE